MSSTPFTPPTAYAGALRKVDSGRTSVYPMRVPRLLTLWAATVALGLAAPAQASVPHTVQPGETLWSIAAANGFTTRSLAAANGLSETSNVVLGSTIQIPTVGEAAGALNGT